MSRGTLRISSFRLFAYARLTLFAGPSHALLLNGNDCWILGFSSFARRYLRNRCFFLFLRVLRCFSSPGSLRYAMDSLNGDGSSNRRVSPFGHPRLVGYVLLNVAFRSLSRPSSAPSAKAFALCSLFLDLHECFRISFFFCSLSELKRMLFLKLHLLRSFYFV